MTDKLCSSTFKGFIFVQENSLCDRYRDVAVSVTDTVKNATKTTCKTLSPVKFACGCYINRFKAVSNELKVQTNDENLLKQGFKQLRLSLWQ